MNFQSMEYFIMLAKERSFTKAAERLHITQQTLSAHISAIENELECRLIIRHVPLELTYAGEVFLQYADDFQRKYYSMKREFSDIAHSDKGKLRIGVEHTRGRVIIPDMIMKFQKLYPQIEIQSVEDVHDVLRKKLIDGEIDIAIADLPDKIPGVEVRDFIEEEIVLFVPDSLMDDLYGSRKDAVAERIQKNGELSLLAGCPFLIGDEKNTVGRLGRFFIKRANFHPIVKAQSKNVEMLLELCVKGVGACFCPEELAKAILGEKHLAELKMFRLGEEAKYMIRLGWQAQTYQWSIISKFIEVVMN